MERRDRQQTNRLYGQKADPSSKRDGDAPKTIVPKPYSSGRPSATARLNPFNSAAMKDNLHALTRGGVGNLARTGAAHSFSSSYKPPQLFQPSDAHGDARPRFGDATYSNQTSKFFPARQGAPRTSVADDPLNLLARTRQRVNSSEPINVLDSDEDESLSRDHLPPLAATGDIAGTSKIAQSRNGQMSGRSGAGIVEGRQISGSFSEIPALDLSRTRASGTAARMRPKKSIGTALTLSTVQNSSSTPDFDSFVPYKRVWWGSQCFTANNPNEPTIINIRRAAPAVCLDTFDNFQISGTPPAYKIPYAAIRKVKFLANDQDPIALILSIGQGSEKIISTVGNDRLHDPSFDLSGSNSNASLSTIFFEIDVGGARWISQGHGRLLSSYDMYHRIVGSICQAQNIEKESIREHAAHVLLDAHQESAQDWNRSLAVTSRSGSRSGRQFEDKYPNRLISKSRKRSRSPTPVSERRTQRVRPQPRSATSSSKQAGELKEGRESEVNATANPHELMLVYPLSGVGSVNITRGDYKRLDPGEFFNDTLIEFGLKHAINQIKDANPPLAEDVHIFNSFFYKKLSSKTQSEGYQSVRKWTSKINIFDKRYIFIPINENFHWYLAIIFMPMLVLPLEGIPVFTPLDTRSSSRLANKGTPSKPRLSLTNPGPSPSVDSSAGPPHAELKTDGSTASDITSPSPASESRSVDEMVTSTSQFSLRQINTPPTDTVVHIIDDSASDEHISCAGPNEQPHDTREGKRMDIDQNSAAGNSEPDTPEVLEHQKSEGRMRSGSPPVRQRAKDSGATPSKAVAKKSTTEKLEVPKARIFLLDSLGVEHPQPRRILAQYLLQEAHDKKLIPEGSINDPATKTWFKEHTAGHNVKVPVQPNHCDCGVYLIHFAETFLSNPAELANVMPNARLPPAEKNAIWRKKDVESKRDLMRERIQKLAEEWQSVQATSDRPATSPEPVALRPAETLAVPKNQGAHDAESVSHATAPSSPARQQSTEAGEVEAMLQSAPGVEALGSIHCLQSHNSVSPREVSPSDHAMDLDQPDYQPDPTASSIMFPRETPRRTVHSTPLRTFSSPLFAQLTENAYSYSTRPASPTGSNRAPSYPLPAKLEYPQSTPLTRAPLPNSRTIIQDDVEESPSPPRSSVRDQLRAHRLPHQQAESNSSPEIQTSDMPPDLSPRAFPTPKQLASTRKQQTQIARDHIQEIETRSDNSFDGVVIVDGGDHLAASQDTPSSAIKHGGRFSGSTRSRAGPSRGEPSPIKPQHLKGVSPPPDPVSVLRANVIRAEDAIPGSSATSRTVAKTDKTGPAARIR